ncbi:MAG TPA: hypothetical protein VGE35_03445 [Candidatus Paceibacterota bacterium]
MQTLIAFQSVATATAAAVTSLVEIPQEFARKNIIHRDFCLLVLAGTNSALIVKRPQVKTCCHKDVLCISLVGSVVRRNEMIEQGCSECLMRAGGFASFDEFDGWLGQIAKAIGVSKIYRSRGRSEIPPGLPRSDAWHVTESPSKMDRWMTVRISSTDVRQRPPN